MPRRKRKTGRINVFKEIEARLNKAIFQILAQEGPLTVYDIHKRIRARRKLKYTRYASVNKRVRSLEDLDYVRKIGVKKTKAGFEATLYELTAKVYLAMLFDSINLEDLLKRIDEATALAILGDLTRAPI